MVLSIVIVVLASALLTFAGLISRQGTIRDIASLESSIISYAGSPIFPVHYLGSTDDAPFADLAPEEPQLDATKPTENSFSPETSDGKPQLSAVPPSEPSLSAEPTLDSSQDSPLTVQLHPDGRTDKCLDVSGNFRFNGASVEIYDCNGSGAQDWVLTFGNTKIQLAGSDYCLDAGSGSGNGASMKIWTCYEDLPAQSWYYTYDYRIALSGTGQCLDLRGGNVWNGNSVHTYKCTDFNPYQIWTS